MLGTYSYERLISKIHTYYFAPAMQDLFDFNAEQKAMLEKINQSFFPIYQHFKQHPDLQGLKLDIAIGGGAIRDLIMDKSHLITDLDIFITLRSSRINQEDRNDTRLYYDKILKKCLELHLVTPEEALEASPNHVCFRLIRHVLKDLTPIHQEFLSNVKKLADERVYQHNEISGVFKSQMIFNTDFILLNNTSPAEFIHEHFDFNLCKVGLTYYENDIYTGDKNYTAKPHFLVDDDFVKDAIAQSLSFHTEFLDDEAVSTSLRKHLPKLLQKYPDFEVKLIQPTENHQILLNEFLLRRHLEAQETSTHKKSLRKI